MSIKRKTITTLIVSLAICTTFAFAIYGLLTTTTGLKLGYRIAKLISSDVPTLTGLSGNLLNGIHADSLTMKRNKKLIKLSKVNIAWDKHAFNDMTWKVTKFNALFNDTKLGGHFTLRLIGTKFHLQAADISLGPNHFKAQGSYDKKLNLNWRLTINKMQALDPEWRGQIKGQGTLSADRKKSKLTYHLTSTALTFDDVIMVPMQVDGNAVIKNKKITGQLTVNKVKRTTWPAALLNATMSYQFDKQLSADITGKWRGKNVTAKARLVTHEKGYEIKGDAHARNIIIVDEKAYRVIGDPNLTVCYHPGELSIQGDIFVPRARIDLNALQEQEDLHEDVVYVNEKNPNPKRSTLAILADIKLKLGNDVHLTYRDLKTRLQGALELIDKPGQDTHASGILTLLDGEYHAHGKSFTIRKGTITYNKQGIANPGLDIEALLDERFTPSDKNFATAQPRRVGIRILGSANNPSITLFAEPAGLSQADILSYIVLGKPVDKLSTGEGESLIAEAAVLNTGEKLGFSVITNEIKHKLGLSELRLQDQKIYSREKSAFARHAMLLLGKALSPRLYITYSYDLFNNENSVKLSYALRKNLSVQTNASPSASGVDLVYSFVR